LAIREISINTGTLGRDTAQLTFLLGQLERDKEKMIQEIEALNRMWQGPANQAFNAQFKTDCASFDNLSKTIQEMIRAMERAKSEYEQCDNRVNSLVNALRI